MAFLLDTLIPHLKSNNVINKTLSEDTNQIITKHWDVFLLEHESLDIVVHHDAYGVMTFYTMKKIDKPHDFTFISAFGDYTQYYDSNTDYDFNKWCEIIENLKHYEFNIFSLNIKIPESVYVKESVFYGDLQNKLSKEDFDLVKTQFDKYRNQVYIADDENLKDKIIKSLDSFTTNIFDIIKSNIANRSSIHNPYVTNNVEHNYNRYINVVSGLSFTDTFEFGEEYITPLYDLCIDRNYL